MGLTGSRPCRSSDVPIGATLKERGGQKIFVSQPTRNCTKENKRYSAQNHTQKELGKRANFGVNDFVMEGTPENLRPVEEGPFGKERRQQRSIFPGG